MSELWYVHCGCCHHGDHFGCDKTCQDEGCQHPLRVEFVAATAEESDNHVHGPDCWDAK